MLPRGRLGGLLRVAHTRAVPRIAACPTNVGMRGVRMYSDAPNKACASCGAPNDAAALQCTQCHTLQPVPGEVNYYDLLGVPRSSVPNHGWSVDPRTLKAEWRQKMAVTHPDRLVARSEKEQQIGAQQSAIVNKAYETLLRPLSRAVYLLEQEGVGDVEEGASLEDPALLMEVMELQEALSEAEDQATVDQVAKQNDTHLHETLAQLESAFAQAPPDTQRIKALAIQLRYWSNIANAAREWQPGQRIELHH